MMSSPEPSLTNSPVRPAAKVVAAGVIKPVIAMPPRSPPGLMVEVTLSPITSTPLSVTLPPTNDSGALTEVEPPPNWMSLLLNVTGFENVIEFCASSVPPVKANAPVVLARLKTFLSSNCTPLPACPS